MTNPTEIGRCTPLMAGIIHRVARKATVGSTFGVALVLVTWLVTASAANAAEPGEVSRPEAAENPTEVAASTEATELGVTVAAQQFLPALNLFVAQQAGFFQEEGLEVTIELIRGGPLISNAVQSDAVQIGGMNYDGVILARDRGFDYKLLYPAVMYDANSPDVYLVVRSGSGIESVADLAGRSVALRFGEIPEHAVTALLTDAGVNPDDVEYVEIPFPHMIGALESGQVDAAHIVEPFLSAALKQGIAEILVADLDIVGERFLIHTWFAKGEWIDANPEIVERFARALDRATQLILDDPDAVLPMAAAALETEEDEIAGYFPERYVAATTVTADELQTPIDFSYKWDVIDEQLSYEEFLSPYFPLAP